jgi:acyl carrier protein
MEPGIMKIPLDALIKIIEHTVPGTGTASAVTEDDVLTNIGIDSIANLNIIMEAGEIFNIDLEPLIDEQVTPATVGELRDLLERLPVMS